MERLIMLGTGNALVTRCYNTCFAIQDDDEYFLVDAGGGNGIIRQLQDADISMVQIHHIFLTHEHTDHLLGMIWMIRMIATKMRREQYEGNLRIYCHSALVETVRTIANLTLPKKFTRLLDHRIQFVPLHDGDTKHILDYDVTFFDILSTKAKQYGFTMRLKSGQKLTCAGDEPLNENCFGYAEAVIGSCMKPFVCIRSGTSTIHMRSTTVPSVRPVNWRLISMYQILFCTIPRMTTSNAEKPSIQQKADCIIKEISMCQTTWNV